MLRQLNPVDPTGRQQGAHGNGRRPLYIIIKTANMLAKTLQQGHRISLGEILKLQHGIGPAPPDRIDKTLQELIVLLLVDTLVARAHIHRVIAELFVISANIEHDRQGVGRAYTAAGCVQS